MNYKAVTLGFVLAGTALGSAALTLGRARGAAWIGQPLELVVPVQIDPGQADGGLCAEADVFHGDSRQDANRVQVQVSPGDQPDTLNLKISSSALIDEPVVSVYLRAGCNQKSSRKFVLLADFPSDVSAAPSRVATPTAPVVPMVVPADTSTTSTQAAPSSSTVVSSSAQPPKPAKAPKPAVPVAKAMVKEVAKESPKEPVAEAPKPVAPKKESPPPKPPKAEKPAEPVAQAKPKSDGKPRLRLDPIETLSERVKSLEATTTATSLQDDITRDGQKMQSLQNDLRTLLDQAAKNEASLAAMRERLEKAESDRVPVAVVYGLVALVVLALGALAFLWNKRPRQVVWKEPGRPAAAGAAKETALDVDLADLQ